MIKSALLMMTIFTTSMVEAHYIIRIPVDGIVFVRTQSDESICQASSRYIKDYAKSLGVDIEVGTGFSANVCNVDIYRLSSFENMEQLADIGNYIQSLKAESYSMSSIVYGFNDGRGRPLLVNGRNYARVLWDLR